MAERRAYLRVLNSGAVKADLGMPGDSLRTDGASVLQVMAMGGFHVALLKWARQYGRIFKIFLGRNLVVVVSGA